LRAAYIVSAMQTFLHRFEQFGPEIPSRRHINPDGTNGGIVALSAHVDPSAIVDKTARIGPRAFIGPGAIVRYRAKISAGAWIGPGAEIKQRVLIGERAVIGEGQIIEYRKTVADHERVGA